MQRDHLALAGLALLAMIVVGGGLMVVGGPEQGRMERRDIVRADDVREIVQCLNGMLPAELATLSQTLTLKNPMCEVELTLADPQTGTPYSLVKNADGTLGVCANFETPSKRTFYAYEGAFDVKTGCLSSTAQS